ncbi:transcription initiation factor IIA subunit 2-like [Drosophila subpulchrella]|uniref:transcription initiation factor IIA subunit 2-like n=1 Tax=Drosophila subpulchrella TaxID=1486046 RepID=UPI0018A19763|nr:transcription initiation factor IIA subunit 2-like [Drosophila subpulchrella]
MNYQLYRASTLGTTLQATLDEMVHCNLLSNDLAHKVLLKYDKSISAALSKRVKNKMQFKAEKLSNFRYCDNVWTLLLKNVEFRDGPEVLQVDLVKIVACMG